MPKWFQQACCDQHSNLVHFKAEKPSGLDRIETSRGNFPTQKLRLLCNLVHTTITATTDQAPAGVSNTPKQLPNYPGKTQPVHRVGSGFVALLLYPFRLHLVPCKSVSTNFEPTMNRERLIHVDVKFIQIAIFCTCLLSRTSARGDNVDDYVRSAMNSRHIPGLSLAVIHESRIVKAQGYGLAHVEFSVPATGDTVYQIASITKTFTAAAVMILVEEGKLKLDEQITVYLPSLPPSWSAVTVRHLLNHTSGLKNLRDLPELSRLYFERAVIDTISAEAVLKQLSEFPLQTQPGDKWSYNSTGYFLVKMIIEKLTAVPFEQFLQRRIFQPLEMTCTRFGDSTDVITNCNSMAYLWKTNKLSNVPVFFPAWMYTATGLNSTVLDLAKWDSALENGKLLKQASLTEMFTASTFSTGKSTKYGLGWYVQEYRGHRTVAHGGGDNTYLLRFPDDKLTVIVLCNLFGADASSLAHEIASFFLPQKATDKKLP